jgi:hypothetical protein
MEIVHTGGNGCIILPDDNTRPWSDIAMHATQSFLCSEGWSIWEKVAQLHQYYLDDDKELASSAMLVKHVGINSNVDEKYPSYRGLRIVCNEIPFFYGSTVFAPYPHYILQDGVLDYNWQRV